MPVEGIEDDGRRALISDADAVARPTVASVREASSSALRAISVGVEFDVAGIRRAYAQALLVLVGDLAELVDQGGTHRRRSPRR